MVPRNIYSNLDNEIKTLSTLDNENVVRYYEHFHSPENIMMEMIMELCGGNVEQVCC